MSQVEVTLKSGKTITVRRDEVRGLRDEKLIDESKLSAELKKTIEKEEGTKVIGKASVGNIPKKSKKPTYPIGYIEIELKSGGTIKVKKHEVDGLRKEGLLKSGKSKADIKAEKEAKKLADKEAEDEKLAEAKEKEEKEKTETKEEKGAGTITKDNIKS